MSKPGRFSDNYSFGKEQQLREENDEDEECIKSKTRYVKQQSVDSTRNALRLAREAEETAQNTLTSLGTQSETLANSERHLDVGKGNMLRAEDKTTELKKLNRSIFLPVITFNKNTKRVAQEAKVQARYDEERKEREKAMMEVRETKDRLGRAASYGRYKDDGTEGHGHYKSVSQDLDRKEERKRFQFEVTESDDEIEDELDQNLNEIGKMAKRLKALGIAMGQEVDTQNRRIERIDDKADSLGRKLAVNTDRLKHIK